MAFALLLSWIVAVVINVFSTAEISIRFLAFRSAGCQSVPTRSSGTAAMTVMLLVGYYVPTVIMGVSYGVVLI